MMVRVIQQVIQGVINLVYARISNNSSSARAVSARDSISRPSRLQTYFNRAINLFLLGLVNRMISATYDTYTHIWSSREPGLHIIFNDIAEFK